MASLGAGIISSVGSKNINATPMAKSAGVGSIIQCQSSTQNLKVTPIITPTLGRVAGIMKVSTTNNFKSR